MQLEYFQSNAPAKSKWKEKRVVAIDGSLLNLPHTDEVKKEFGSVSNQYEPVVSARCSFAYDVKNELILDALIAPRKSCEKDLAVQHLEKLNPDTDLLVFDRGYPSQWFMGLLQKKGFHFCFRLSTSWKQAYDYVDESEDDKDWTFTRSSNREWGKLKTYGLSKEIKGLRLVSVLLSSGEREILVTNLVNRQKYSFDDIKALYNLRWGVEEGYKSFKKVLHIEHFSGRTAQAIYQDFHARTFMLNMASMIRTQGAHILQPSLSKTKHRYAISKTQAIAKTKDFLFDIFYGKKLKSIVHQMLKLLNIRREIVRPDRSFIRPKTSSRRRHKIINLKGI